MVTPLYYSDQRLLLLLELVLLINGINGLGIQNVRMSGREDSQLDRPLSQSDTLYNTDDERSGDSKFQQNAIIELRQNQTAFIETGEAIKKWDAIETSVIMDIGDDKNGLQLNQTESNIIIACGIGSGSVSMWAYALFALIIFLLIASGVYCFCPFCCGQRLVIQSQGQEYSKVDVRNPAESNRLTRKVLSVIPEDDDD